MDKYIPYDEALRAIIDEYEPHHYEHHKESVAVKSPTGEIKIIRQGKSKEELDKAYRRFECLHCGCIFEADKYYVCPNCKSDVQEAM